MHIFQGSCDKSNLLSHLQNGFDFSEDQGFPLLWILVILTAFSAPSTKQGKVILASLGNPSRREGGVLRTHPDGTGFDCITHAASMPLST